MEGMDAFHSSSEAAASKGERRFLKDQSTGKMILEGVRMGAAAVFLTPLAMLSGTIMAPIAATRRIWAHIKYHDIDAQKIRLSELKDKLKDKRLTLASKNLLLSPGSASEKRDLVQKNGAKQIESLMHELEQTHDIQKLEELEVQASSLESKIQKRETKTAHLDRQLGTALLMLIPFLGIPAAGLYLSTKSHEKGITQNIIETMLSGQKTVAHSFTYPGNTDQSAADFYASKKETAFFQSSNTYLKSMKASEQSIAVDRGDGKTHTLSAFMIPPRGAFEFDPSRKTAVVFHGNMETAYSKLREAKQYIDQGCNVVLVTMGGYAGSDTGLRTSEITTIQDAHAVMRWLKGQYEERGGEGCAAGSIIVHGFSIGTSLALRAAQMHPSLVSQVVLDAPVDTIRDASVATVEHLQLQAGPIKPHRFGRIVPKAVVRGAIDAEFTTGQKVPGVLLDASEKSTLSERQVETNGINLAALASEPQLQGIPMLIFKRQCDDIMGRGVANPLQEEDGTIKRFDDGAIKYGYEVNAADRLAEKRNATKTTVVLCEEADHCEWVLSRYDQPLVQNGAFNPSFD